MSVYAGKLAGHKFKGSGTIANGYAWIYNSTTQQFELTDLSATYAPATPDYLVGTTQAGLSAEIVVGTAPGGELGGTWASPTVDATHSGSTHVGAYASVQTAGSALLGTLYEVVVDLTNAEILTLFSVGKELLPAPGADLIYAVETLIILKDFTAGAYVGGGTVQPKIGGIAAGPAIASAFFTEAAGTGFRFATSISTVTIANGNQALILSAITADFTGGNAANTATVRVLYRTLSTLPN